MLAKLAFSRVFWNTGDTSDVKLFFPRNFMATIEVSMKDKEDIP
jgi:hypothetical protein